MPVLHSVSSEQLNAALGENQLYCWPDRRVASKPWVIFRVISTTRGVAQSDQAITKVLASIVMPLPPSALQASYHVNYQETELGTTLGLLNKSGVTTAGTSLSAQPTMSSWISSLLRMFGDGASAAGKQIGVEALDGAASILNALNQNSADALSAFYRQRLNPRIEQLFKNVQFRDFQFNWDLMPGSDEESRNLEAIISIFKFAMLPAYQAPINHVTTSDGAFAYPHEFDILYFDQQYLFRPLRCVLSSVDVNYAGSGELAFFRANQQGGTRSVDHTLSSGRPAHVKLDLKFREIQLLTRDQFAQTVTDVPGDDLFGRGELVPNAPTTSNQRVYRF